MNLLLTGATGFIGTHLRRRLLEEGHDLTIITRSPGSWKEVSANNHRFISWDSDLVAAMEAADVVINMAGENLFDRRWSESVKKKLYDSRIESTRVLVEAMGSASDRPELLISVSGVNYYGERGEDPLEESEPPGHDFLAMICQDWEAEAQKAKAFGIRVSNPRVGVVLHPDDGALDKMILPFKLFIGGPIGRGSQYMPWIHMDDLCRALLFPMHEETFSGPYNACSPSPETMRNLARLMGKVMNRPSLMRVPEWAVKLLLGESATPVLTSLKVIPAQLRQAGFQWTFEDLEEALADLL